MRLGAALAAYAALLGAAWADGPPAPRWMAAKPADCAGFSHPDQVVALIRAAKSCRDGTRLYYACEARWFNNPEMEEAATNACENRTRALSEPLRQRYEDAQQACETRYQAADMRILWSAVRACKVRLAERWARRYPER